MSAVCIVIRWKKERVGRAVGRRKAGCRKYQDLKAFFLWERTISLGWWELLSIPVSSNWQICIPRGLFSS